MGKKIIFYSIKFFDYEFKYLVNRLQNSGGYIVAPAASSLSEIFKKKIYYESLRKSNIAILDSGFFCVLLRIFKRKKVKKFSGYLFLKSILELKKLKYKKFFLINPSLYEQNKNYNLLRTKGIFNQQSYLAPVYNLSNFKDLKLIKKINLYNPDIIIINLGGGIQEPLGQFISQNIKKKINCNYLYWRSDKFLN
tara:strand:+ start:2941 stop:3522 length:582 start_codon:yes stop_codon:yes gene_type:complete